ncbi:MAG TPA: glycosyltransferase family 87 protein [Candidatus Acidoferrum sp.]|nr:glycosyltransferase family 87 protein [Candidatus Acidoferrum sp.]
MATPEKQFTLAGGLKRRRLAQVLIAAMLWSNLLLFFHFREGISRGYPDFTVFYTAAKMLRQGLSHQLYNSQLQWKVQQTFAGNIPFRSGPLPYIHPPFEALIFLPLTWLSYPRAFVAWDLFNILILFGVARLLRRSVETLRIIPEWKLAIGSIAFFPVFACLFEGQDSILMLLCCALGFYALKRNADVLSGCWLALAAFKFQFMIPIVLLFVIWKRRRVVIGFLAVATVLALISLALVGVRSFFQYPAYVLRIANSLPLSGVPADLLPNLHGLVMGWHGPLSGTLGKAIAALGTIALFVLAAWRGWTFRHPGRLELQFSLAVVTAVLVAWQTNTHDLSLLVLPLALDADYRLRNLDEEASARYPLPNAVLPLLISPVWIVIWFVLYKVNLMAIPLLWWTWTMGREPVGDGR